MGDGDPSARPGSMKALLGVLAGAGASYGIYKLVSGGSFKKYKKSVTGESPVGKAPEAGEAGVASPPGGLRAQVSGLDVVCPRPPVAPGNRVN